MSQVQVKSKGNIQRCAQCRIDRKGRLVFVDDEIESLLGLTQVELFGRQFTDFLVEEDHEVVERMMSQCNHYETVYDSTQITLLGANGQSIKAILILSLNFGGGHPANYQVVLRVDEPAVAASEAPEAASDEKHHQDQVVTFPTLDLLQRIGAAGLLNDSQGQVVDCNEEMARLLGSDRTGQPLLELIATLTAGDAVAHEALISFYQASSGDAAPAELRLSLNRPSAQAMSVAAVRLLPGSDDLSSYIIAMPPNTAASSRQPSFGFLRMAVELMKSSVAAGQVVNRKLEHEHHEELSGEGGHYLKCLRSHLTKTAGILTDLDQLLRILNDDIALETTAPGLIVDQLREELTTVYPGKTITIKGDKLPKLVTCRRSLTLALTNVLTNSVKHAGRKDVNISIEANLVHNQAAIKLSDNGPGIPKKRRRQLMEYAARLSLRMLPGAIGEASSLAFTRELIENAGGRLELAGNSLGGTTVTIWVPIEAPNQAPGGRAK